MQGSIKLYRSFLDWEWWHDHNTARVFLYLLLNANWKDSRYKGYEIPKGSLVVGRSALAKQVGLSEQQVRTSLEHLKSTNEITVKATNKFTIVTIVNWEKYQYLENESTNKSTNKLTNNQPTSNQQVTTSEESNKGIIKERYNNKLLYPKKSLPEKPKIPLIDKTEYEIEEDFYKEIESAYPRVEIDKELSKMRAWCIANPKKLKTRRGVHKFINSWLDRAEETKPEEEQKEKFSAAFKNYIQKSFRYVAKNWLDNNGVELTESDWVLFRDMLLSCADESEAGFVRDDFCHAAIQDEEPNFKEFITKWRLANGK